MSRKSRKNKNQKQKILVLLLALIGFGGYLFLTLETDEPIVVDVSSDVDVGGGELAVDVLARIPVKGRAPRTGYSRSEFSSGWAQVDGCDMRNRILRRDMWEVELADDSCTVLRGVLSDPYTGEVINFVRGPETSRAVQIDHVVSLSNAWQTGAQQLTREQRREFANDPLNLLAVDGPANQQKSDSDAASWLPANKVFRCEFVARQVAVKYRHFLWVTEPEHAAISRVLAGCPGERVIEKNLRP